jgi:hypothetical protein
MIDDFLQNVFNGANVIIGLMRDHGMAKENYYNVKDYYTTFAYPELGYKIYKAKELIDLWELAEKTKYADIVSIYKNPALTKSIRLDAAAMLLIVSRNVLAEAIQSVKLSRQLRTDGKHFTYLFKNPYPPYVTTTPPQKNYLDIELINIWNSSHPSKFKPLIPFDE